MDNTLFVNVFQRVANANCDAYGPFALLLTQIAAVGRPAIPYLFLVFQDVREELLPGNLAP